MKCRYDLARDGMATVCIAEPEQYDGKPATSEVVTLTRIRFINADRSAIAAALLYFEYIAGGFSCDKPCSHEVAIALARLFEPRKVVVSNIEFTPKAIPSGARTAMLAYDGRTASGDVPCDMTFGVAADQHFSSLLSVDDIQLASNVRLLFDDRPMNNMLKVLGLLVLFAEDYGIGSVVVPAADADISQIVDLQALSALLQLVNITLLR